MNSCVINPPDVAWTARVTSARNQVRYMCVKKCTTDISSPEARSITALSRSGPGTARFRWLAKDVTLWTSCPRGCCQLMP